MNTSSDLGSCGPYLLHKRLGSGQFGTVYQAQDTRLKRFVALKVLKAMYCADPDMVKRFMREAQAAALLVHPNIVDLFEMGETEGSYYLAMRYVAGVTLSAYLQPDGKPMQALALPQVSTWVGQLADALNYAHQQGFVHRDVKPSNILIESPSGSANSASARAILTDFGLVKMLVTHSAERSFTDLTSGGRGGTPAYIAPEVWGLGNDAGVASPAADTYALACVTYEMLTGRSLFGADSGGKTHTIAIYERHKAGPDLREIADADLRHTLAQALHQDPSQRLPIVALASQLAWLAERPAREAVAAAKAAAAAQAEAAAQQRDQAWQRKLDQHTQAAKQRIAALEKALDDAQKQVLATQTAAKREAATATEREQTAKQRIAALEKALDDAKEQLQAAQQQSERAATEAQARAAAANHQIAQLSAQLGQTQADLRAERDKPRGWLASLFGTGKIETPVTPQKTLIQPAYTLPILTEHDVNVAVTNGRLRHIGKGTVNQVAISPDGEWLAVASSLGIYIYDLEGRPRAFCPSSSPISCIAYSPDGQFIASGSGSGYGVDNPVKVWEASSGREVSSLSGHTESVTSVAYSPDGKFIVSGSWDETVKVWEASSGREVRSLSGHTSYVYSVAYSPDGKFIASGSGSDYGADNTVKVWEASSGRKVRSLSGHTESVR
nr:protein kinase [Anaerolineae bacterium]